MNILICAAGSGGHIYPAISLAEELKIVYPKAQIVFLSTKRSIEAEILKNTLFKKISVEFCSPYMVKSVHLLTFILKNLNFLLKFMTGSMRVIWLLFFLKPKVVVGFGGIGSVAAILGARILRIPTLIHEQNVIPGLANRFLSYISTNVAISYNDSAVYFKSDNIEYTGNPLRADLEKKDKFQARRMLGLLEDKFTILIFGGSQGSEFINRSVIEALKELSLAQINAIQVIHVIGSRVTNDLGEGYRKAGVQAKLFEYLYDMSSAYSAADLVICRAGAAALNEITYFGLASILIPYPFAGRHQVANAEFMQSGGASCLLIQDENSSRNLGCLVNNLLKKPEVLNTMAEKSKQLFNLTAKSNLVNMIKRLVI
ncbi:MAG: undecaprenyldiphospho-muramoylpentapeptide beta-N-acetylglucosaminyltransferase [Candidatus Omnitrophica bacterium]|nr:undecaprenyldiphospho-muramoylpentapeptide beta-N-acetylglucosaminyltransferase [Candidatus Omnitrophota bacterium]